MYICSSSFTSGWTMGFRPAKWGRHKQYTIAKLLTNMLKLNCIQLHCKLTIRKPVPNGVYLCIIVHSPLLLPDLSNLAINEAQIERWPKKVIEKNKCCFVGLCHGCTQTNGKSEVPFTFYPNKNSESYIILPFFLGLHRLSNSINAAWVMLHHQVLRAV